MRRRPGDDRLLLMDTHSRDDRQLVERIGRSLPSSVLDMALIVVSILIAFSLDAWWQGQQREAQEREALETLAKELAASRTELDSVMDFNERRAEAAHYFRTLAGRDLATLPLDSLSFAFGAQGGGMTFDPGLGATQAIIDAGLPADPELRAKIAAWPSMLREIEADQGFILTRYEKLADALVDAGMMSRRAAFFEQFESATAEPTLRQEAEFRELTSDLVTNPVVRERVAALGSSLEELQRELSEVEARLGELQAAVGRELEE